MKKLIKKILPGDSAVFKYLRKLYKKRFKLWLPQQVEVENILERYSKTKSPVNFIQVGANDGVSGDPLHHYIFNAGWQGVLVEPVPFLFERLKKNYAAFSDKLIFENSAIAKEDGTATFYRLKESNDPGLPEWYDQIGSFKKEVVLSHSDMPGFKEHFIEEEIKTISFQTLLNKHQLKKVDLIHIDTEGYDFEILKLINFNEVKPDIVIYEYKHLSIPDFRRSLKLMRKNGFALYGSYLDIICINEKVFRFS